MGGIFGVASKESCVFDLFFGIDYHSHLGTRRGGMAVYSKEKGFDRSIPILKIRRFGQSSSGMWRNCPAILESVVFLIVSLSRFWFDLSSRQFCHHNGGKD